MKVSKTTILADTDLGKKILNDFMSIVKLPNISNKRKLQMLDDLVIRRIKIHLTDSDTVLKKIYLSLGETKESRSMQKAKILIKKAIKSWENDFNYMLKWRKEIDEW